MVVHISDSVVSRIAQDRRAATEIKHLFVLFERGYHRWYLGEDDDAELYTHPALGSFREFIEKGVAASIYESDARTHTVSVLTDDDIGAMAESLSQDGETDCRVYLDGRRIVRRVEGEVHEYVSVEIVESFLGRPLRVLPENPESDGLFIKTCLRYIGGVDSSTLWLEIDNGGGSNMRQVVTTIGGRERVLCVLDGGWLAPGVKERSEATFEERLRTECERLGCQLFVLLKREVENYLPDDAIRRYLCSKGQLNPDRHPYFTLSEEQKDYFDLKGSQHQADGLPGFGEDIWRAFEQVESRAELESRDRVGELQSLVNTIFDLL